MSAGAVGLSAKCQEARELPALPAAAKQKEARLVAIKVVEIRRIIFIVAK
jgi:hypothetical protein